MNHFTTVEARIDDAARALLLRLPRSSVSDALVEFLVFGLKQGWACLFGGLFLSVVLATGYLWPAVCPLPRYDFLVGVAIAIQIAMLTLKLEQPFEALVILMFHFVGTVMELFKTSHGSWAYPEFGYLKVGAVPLFSGFMYAAVGSYIARVTRIFDMRYAAYPPAAATYGLALAIYINFFTHHYLPDARWLLFAATAVLFARTWVHYHVFRRDHRMPLLLGFALVALFIWIAENVGSWSHVWLYPNQLRGFALVAVGKFGSWFLLMIISFVLVNIVHRPKPLSESSSSRRQAA